VRAPTFRVFSVLLRRAVGSQRNFGGSSRIHASRTGTHTRQRPTPPEQKQTAVFDVLLVLKKRYARVLMSWILKSRPLLPHWGYGAPDPHMPIGVASIPWYYSKVSVVKAALRRSPSLSYLAAPAQGAAPAELEPEGDGAADGAALGGFRQE
jgi:hypothetical protein